MKKLTAAIIISAAAILLLFYPVTDQKNTGGQKVLKAYKNTVALYEDGVKTKVYSQIVLNNLPLNDIKKLKEGIEVSSETELNQVLEDFDG